ncbi:glycoside hydrolase family 10 protein [Inhella proteolytica]|uniref:Family 10 glycosylhydrolase n=1 Tax=Inhella proteolytica TaxID=2795029 RepID=A0A931NDD5_9BURK|nr:family 10 glycosylhydrolase [Inhella proteolytica]MBH9576557.1 family 10 glycosylhydrolase [Inhella proteolytica]
MKRRELLLATPALLGGCAVLDLSGVQPAPALQAPAIPREFRAAWVATVANIDWPSRPGLPTAAQQEEARRAVQQAARLGLNALILQVRTAADALYPSALEPWAEWLSGTQGQAPEPAWDPLAFWLREAHAAGLELHAWLNPYRAQPSAAKGPRSATHVSQARPEWVRRYGDQLWLDPAEEGAAAQTLAVARDLLARYPLDGLHIDDYFYPYPVKDAAGQWVDFPDEAAWARYQASGGLMRRADWRRAQVDALVQRLHASVHELRPTARFGISPFGLMKPALRPAGIQGFSQFDQLYADVERWLSEGWLDYLVPQLYWPRAQTAQAFEPLLRSWQQLNPKGRHLWPGLFTSKVTEKDDSWPVEEIEAQIALTRQAQAGGHVHFSWVALGQNRRGMSERLRTQAYAQAALPPATPWLADAVPGPLQLERVRPVGGAPQWQLRGPDEAPLRRWLWWREAGAWRGELRGPGPFDWPAQADALVACALSVTGLEGPRGSWSRA